MARELNRLILLMGLPRSGKSTFAVKLPHPIVSPDAIRLQMTGKQYFQPVEDLVWGFARMMARSLFEAGCRRVLVDATNTTRQRREEWRSPMWVRDFIVVGDNSPETAALCMQRAEDVEEPYRQGLREAIMRMHKGWERIADEELTDGGNVFTSLTYEQHLKARAHAPEVTEPLSGVLVYRWGEPHET